MLLSAGTGAGAAAQAVPATAPSSVPPSSVPQEGTGAPADPQAAAADNEDSATPEDIVVTGFRRSLAQGLELKREAIGVRDSIVAEDIGKFPEANVADSLQRIPGVILSRDGASNEGQKISIRGLSSDFTVTTINMAPVRTTSALDVGGSSRNFNYDVFPSELFGRVDVYKTPLANLEEGGIGGNVDLQTPRPFDSKSRVIRYTAQANYNTSRSAGARADRCCSAIRSAISAYWSAPLIPARRTSARVSSRPAAIILRRPARSGTTRRPDRPDRQWDRSNFSSTSTIRAPISAASLGRRSPMACCRVFTASSPPTMTGSGSVPWPRSSTRPAGSTSVWTASFRN
jgi:hypothetical protein